jgi:sarcosine oxidase subunit beta
VSRAGEYDVLVLGGGIMGCSTALRLTEAGMRVAVLERGRLCAAASGVNAGTLSLQIKRAALIPYALRGLEIWRTMAERLGTDVGFHVRGGLAVAFTEEEVEVLRARMSERRAAGAPIEIVDAKQARRIEPGLSEAVVLASHCPVDGYSNSSLIGLAFRKALARSAVEVREASEVHRIERQGAGWAVWTGGAELRGRRLVLAAGAWLGPVAALLGVHLPVHVRVNQVAVTDRNAPLFRAIVGHALGVLTLKQSDNGTVLIGGGWQGTGGPESSSTEVILDNLVGNIRLARFAIPALAGTRLVRVWHGLEAHVPDFLPLAGALGRGDDVFVLGCVRGGYTIGPYIGRLLADRILGREPELPLFDPNRFDRRATAAGAAA